jgi:Translation elongation factors (GTPases)
MWVSSFSSASNSGVVNSGDTIYNPVKGKKERIGRILHDARQPA